MATKKSETKKLTRSLEASGFYSDAEKEGCLYAALVRSPAPAGKIKSITAPELPEGYLLYTSKDLPGAKALTANKTTTKIFGYGNVTYSGEPVGIIFGPDEEKVYQLLNTVNINFDVENLDVYAGVKIGFDFEIWLEDNEMLKNHNLFNIDWNGLVGASWRCTDKLLFTAESGYPYLLALKLTFQN